MLYAGALLVATACQGQPEVPPEYPALDPVGQALPEPETAHPPDASGSPNPPTPESLDAAVAAESDAQP